jgi:hypothetical protein
MKHQRESMNLRFRIATLIAVLLTLATTAFPREIRTDYDHKVDFSRYKTYSWIKVDTSNPLWADRVKEAVDKALAAKGWQKVPNGGDVALVAVGTTREKPELRTFYDGLNDWGWSGFGDGVATTTVENYRVGTLIVDMFDSQTKKLIWRGSVSDMLSDKPEKNEKELQKSVQKMFEHFPPKSERASAEGRNTIPNRRFTRMAARSEPPNQPRIRADRNGSEMIFALYP